MLQGAMVLMMGTKAEDVIKEPTVKPVFVEDMNEAELAMSVSKDRSFHKSRIPTIKKNKRTKTLLLLSVVRCSGRTTQFRKHVLLECDDSVLKVSS